MTFTFSPPTSFQPFTNSTPKAKTFWRPTVSYFPSSESGPPPTISSSYVPPFNFYPIYYCLHLDSLVNSQSDFSAYNISSHIPLSAKVMCSAHYLNQIPNFLWVNSSFPLNLIQRISFCFTTLYQSRPNKLLSFFPSLPFPLLSGKPANVPLLPQNHRILELKITNTIQFKSLNDFSKVDNYMLGLKVAPLSPKPIPFPVEVHSFSLNLHPLEVLHK